MPFDSTSETYLACATGRLSLLSKYVFFAVFLRREQWNLTDDLHFLQFFTMLALRVHIRISVLVECVTYTPSALGQYSHNLDIPTSVVLAARIQKNVEVTWDNINEVQHVELS